MLGFHLALSLGDARVKSDTARTGLKIDHIDPEAAQTESAKAAVVDTTPVITFADDAQTFYDSVHQEWKSIEYRRDWMGRMCNHVYPHIAPAKPPA